MTDEDRGWRDGAGGSPETFIAPARARCSVIRRRQWKLRRACVCTWVGCINWTLDRRTLIICSLSYPYTAELSNAQVKNIYFRNNPYAEVKVALNKDRKTVFEHYVKKDPLM